MKHTVRELTNNLMHSPFVVGVVFTCLQDDMYEWEVTTEKKWEKNTMPRLKGRNKRR